LFKHIPAISLAAIAMIGSALIGCNTQPAAPPPPPIKQYASTQTADVVAQLEAQKFTRGELDELLYKSYGLRMLFDIVELRLAQNTLELKGLTITQADYDAERKHIIAGIRNEEGPPDGPANETPAAKAARLQAYDAEGENLFHQFLEQQHITKAEFDVKVIQTDAILRKICTPIFVGKLSDETVHRAFEQLYGAKRKIADIELLNARDATIAAQRLKTEPFAQVAREMSVDPKTKDVGGEWENTFTTQSNWVPQAIRDAAFAMNKGQISDFITEESRFHIIKVLDTIPPDPKLVKFDDVKDAVRKQMEDQLILNGMKTLREELTEKARQELVFDEPVLKAEWDALLDEKLGKNRDRQSALNALNAQAAKAVTQPATAP
jgi:hypothetical protein